MQTKYLDMETWSQAQLCLDLTSLPAASHMASLFSAVNGTALNMCAGCPAQLGFGNPFALLHWRTKLY